ncbi:TolC family protein [Lacibacter sp.]|uniref:TolC family protein n=1 Tax=Lacibacter sp. TaxID=1915409 RepID=UPI002B4B3D24|nr:TolC family protein [Lacibacter sp.]HLP38172.1 TolC family protein [Lacibacter sp.]
MKKLTIYISTCLLIGSAQAQTNVDSVVKQIERNNKSIQSNKKYWTAKQAEFKTGLTLYDPQVEYDYMFGSPVGAGNQQDFAVTQRLDFPSAYKRKKQLSGQQIAQTNLQQQAYRQDVLLEAKMLALKMVYLNKKDAELKRRLANTKKLVQDLLQKLDNGEVIILDVNKAKLQLLNIQNEVKLNENEQQITLTKIEELNGGIKVSITDTVYPAQPFIPDFETLDSTIEANDPVIKVYEQEKNIWQQQIAVQKAMNLPKLETGYRSQGILGQSYKGFHVGITVPLWENKNRLNAAKANLDYAVSNAETSRLSHRLENKQYYELLDVRLKMLQEYKELLAGLNNTALLNKALALGQITIIQYFYDESFYFIAYDKYLQAEWEYQQAIANLYKYQL